MATDRVMTGAAEHYFEELLAPYRDALEEANSIESIRAWVPQVFGEYSDSVLESLRLLDAGMDPDIYIQAAREEVTEALASFISATLDWTYPILPWDLVKTRDEFTTRLFGPASDVVPINITVDGNTYRHMLTQDFVYGLLSVLQNNPDFIVSVADILIDSIFYSVFDTRLSLDNFSTRYTDPIRHGYYTVIIPTGQVYFDGTDLIRGVTTAAQWINTDPHTLITNFTRTADNTPLTF